MRIVAIWAVWSAAILLLASLAWRIRFETVNPWTELSTDPPLARWDATWYREIAEKGYRYDRANLSNSVGYYPLFPLAAGALARALGIDFFTVGIALSLLCLLGALLLFGDYVAEWLGREAILPAVVCLLFFPTSFFFAAPYTESFFFLATVAAIRGSRRGKWMAAAAGGFAAALLRLNGVLVALPIAWYAWERAERRFRRLEPRAFAAVTATLSAAAVFPLYLWIRFGDPLLYLHAKAAGWSQKIVPVWSLAPRAWRELTDAVAHPRHEKSLMFLLALASLVLFVLLTAALFRRGRIAEGLYAAATLAVFLHSGVLQGAHRYVLALFPCFAVLSEFLTRRPAAAFAYAFAGIAGEAYLLAAFVHWIYVA